MKDCTGWDRGSVIGPAILSSILVVVGRICITFMSFPLMMGVDELFLIVMKPWCTVHSCGVGHSASGLSGPASTATTWLSENGIATVRSWPGKMVPAVVILQR